MAAVWLIEEDTLRVCPDNPKILQRFAMAVVYFSTGGDSWFQCSANPAAIDPCGVEEPFVGAERFLAPTSECAWAGISCLSGCVTEIEFGKCPGLAPSCPAGNDAKTSYPFSLVHGLQRKTILLERSPLKLVS